MLAIILVYFNFTDSVLIKQRFQETVARFRALTPHVYCMEASYDGNFDFEGQPNTRCFKVKSKIWYKENLINKAIKELPAEYTNVAWIDGDVELCVQDPVGAIESALTRAEIVQLFSRSLWLNAQDKVETDNLGVVYGYRTNQHCDSPGLAWAARRSTLVRVGYLPERNVACNGDTTFALGMVPSWGLPTFKSHLYQASDDLQQLMWAYITSMRSKKVTFDYIDAPLKHYYHSDYKNRNYNSRAAITKTFKLGHLSYDENGLMVLDNPIMEKESARFFDIKDAES